MKRKLSYKPDEVLRRVETSTPINMQAVRSFLPGEHWNPKIKHAFGYFESDTPLITTRPPKDVPQLTGVKFGKFTVIGWLGKLGEGKNAIPQWLVRCVCGWYESRTTRAIRNPVNSIDACRLCRKLHEMKRWEYWRRTGHTAPLDFQWR